MSSSSGMPIESTFSTQTQEVNLFCIQVSFQIRIRLSRERQTELKCFVCRCSAGLWDQKHGGPDGGVANRETPLLPLDSSCDGRSRSGGWGADCTFSQKHTPHTVDVSLPSPPLSDLTEMVPVLSCAKVCGYFFFCYNLFLLYQTVQTVSTIGLKRSLTCASRIRIEVTLLDPPQREFLCTFQWALCWFISKQITIIEGKCCRAAPVNSLRWWTKHNLIPRLWL